ncbi:shikimate dehydrogenase [Thermoleptolyngbya sichuanensis XZ-Cy5]|uniref:shikimate dehydrogenase n=1 Tax=Thermoleptolyngbya sichuanensis TaxID=2885951 RepID=UPI00240D131F|nr:shikimate dehydrogenase [Thermoleptolyngbya sichuanensis]MDG2617918.1 shikimate dehydrogenase [Thermoleptolyngbya sichuanensis XZ-Cy5]
MTGITGTTKLLGVIGHPVSHSLSPVMHNAAIAHLGVDYVYLPLPVAPEDLPQAIAGFAAIGLRGFNVTIPHKQAVIPFLNHISEIAQSVGAVNTIWRTETGWAGTNTDVEGFLSPLLTLLPERSPDWSQSTAVILGNGGAARAVVAGCAQLGLAQIHVVGRDLNKLKAFQQSWRNSPIAALSVHPWEDLPNLLPGATLLVNTTPIGMHPHIQASPLGAEPGLTMKPGAIAYDLIYTPNPTRFLQQVTALGAMPISGLEMLVQQGAAALRLWLGQEVPVEVMRQALIERLRGGGSA